MGPMFVYVIRVDGELDKKAADGMRSALGVADGPAGVCRALGVARLAHGP